MGLSEIPPPPEEKPGQDFPSVRAAPPGPQSRTWLTRYARASAPMGPRGEASNTSRVVADVPADTIVFSTAKGCNVIDVDSNRYVDLAAGFGSLLLGHGHAWVQRVLSLQQDRLWQSLGDVYPAEGKIALLERLSRLHPAGDARVILAQSGSEAVTAALKSAALHTGRAGVVAFRGSYHGLGYGPLAVSSFRDSYRAPFADQLNPHVWLVDFPSADTDPAESIAQLAAVLEREKPGAVIVEPIQGRAGVRVPPSGWVEAVATTCREHGALLIADEIWTALGRSGAMLCSAAAVPDLICLGKGLGGGLPISACIGRAEVMAAWSRDAEVVHTSTFAGAPLACATALATLDVLEREKLVERARELGADWLERIRRATRGSAAVSDVRGAGLMIGVQLTGGSGAAVRIGRELLKRGYITSTGGSERDVLVLTPPLVVAEPLLMRFVDTLKSVLDTQLA